MMHRRCIEVVDNTLRDVMGTVDPSLENLPFGGKLGLFGGDLRQLFPVIRANSRSTVVNACITKSNIWSHVTKKKLTENMRQKLQLLKGEAGHTGYKCIKECMCGTFHALYTHLQFIYTHVQHMPKD